MPQIAQSKFSSFFFSDLSELVLPKTCQTEFPDHDDILNFKLIISPDEVRQTAFKSLIVTAKFSNGEQLSV